MAIGLYGKLPRHFLRKLYLAFLTAQKKQWMRKNKITGIILVVCLLCSCATKNITTYYYQNKPVLDSIEKSYKDQYRSRRFTLEFTDKLFDHVSLEIWTDSIKYIYEFSTTEKRFTDTLLKYNLIDYKVNSLIRQMQSTHCTWVNNLDYYTGSEKHSMIFISIRPRAINFLARKKYYILAYFNAPQYYDKEGRLMVNRRLRRVRKINADVFHRISDKVAYSLSDRFR
jgi:hypothetical protein